MREELLKYFGPQERPIVVAGERVTVRTMPDDADVTAFANGQDTLWKFVTRCTFDDKGERVFSDEDIPVLKAAPRVTTIQLINAVQDVNGFNAFLEVKNSEAAPSSG